MEIPEDVMKTAFDVLAEADDGRSTRAAATIIARAILAERERCAKCCEGDFDSEMRSYGDYFAKMIRGA